MEWTTSASADEQHRDQEADLGDGWWFSVIQRDDGSWGWGVYDRWLHDDADLVASGLEASEDAAMAHALLWIADEHGSRGQQTSGRADR